MISCACLCLLSFLRVRIIPKMYTRAHARDLISTQHTLRMYSSHSLHAITYTHTRSSLKKARASHTATDALGRANAATADDGGAPVSWGGYPPVPRKRTPFRGEEGKSAAAMARCWCCRSSLSICRTSSASESTALLFSSLTPFAEALLRFGGVGGRRAAPLKSPVGRSERKPLSDEDGRPGSLSSDASGDASSWLRSGGSGSGRLSCGFFRFGFGSDGAPARTRNTFGGSATAFFFSETGFFAFGLLTAFGAAAVADAPCATFFDEGCGRFAFGLTGAAIEPSAWDGRRPLKRAWQALADALI